MRQCSKCHALVGRRHAIRYAVLRHERPRHVRRWRQLSLQMAIASQALAPDPVPADLGATKDEEVAPDMTDVQANSAPIGSPDKTEIASTAPIKKRKSTDIWLNVIVVVLILGVLGVGAYFGYTVYRDKQLENATSPAGRVAAALSSQVRKNPNDAVLRVRLGEAYAAMGKFPQAIEQLNAAIKINPKHVGAYYDLGMVASMNKRQSDAEAYFQKVISLTDSEDMANVDATRENAFFNLGLIALDRKEYDQAAGSFKAALRIRSDSSDTYYQLAHALQALGDTDGAIQQVGMAVTFDPSFAEAHYYLGQLFQSKQDQVNASFEFRNAANQAPGNNPPQQALAAMGTAASWVSKAKASFSAGDLSSALNSALVAGNIDPTNKDAAALLQQIDAANPKAMLDAYTAIALRDPTNAVVQQRIVVIKKQVPAPPKSTSKSTKKKTSGK